MSVNSGTFILADGIDTVVSRQVNSGTETRSALTQWAAGQNLGSGGTATLPTGVMQSVAPTTGGTWPTVTRAAGARLWWLRALTTSTNAPIPTAQQGYQDGDIISPPADPTKGEFLPYTGLVWSDSMIVTSVQDLEGRLTNQYAGGREPATWTLKKGGGASSTGAVRPTNSLDLYDLAVATTSWPLNIKGNYRVTWDVYATDGTFYGGLILRGQTDTTRLVILQVKGDAAGGVIFSLCTWQPEAWAPAQDIGTVAAPTWSPVQVTVNGNTITIVFAGKTLTHTLTGEAATLPRQFGFFAGTWGKFYGRNIKFEVLP